MEVKNRYLNTYSMQSKDIKISRGVGDERKLIVNQRLNCSA